MIEIPGISEGLQVIENTLTDGIPVNVSLLFLPEQYEAAALEELRGIDKRIEKGLNPDIRSVASVFVSRWDKEITGMAPANLRNILGNTVMQKVYHSYRGILRSQWVQRVIFVAFPKRLLRVSTGTKDRDLPDTLYVHDLGAL